MLIYDREEAIEIDGQVKYQMQKYNYKTKLTATVQFALFKWRIFVLPPLCSTHVNAQSVIEIGLEDFLGI